MLYRLDVPYQVRRGLRYGHVLEASALYATIEWEPYVFEEVDQFDQDIEIVDNGNPYAELDRLDMELWVWKDEPQKQSLTALQYLIEATKREIEPIEERDARYQRHLAEEGHRARSVASTNTERREAA